MSKIMIVDDNPEIVELIKQILLKEGYETKCAYDGKECLEMLKKENVDLIILDVMMPDMSGWDVYNEIKKLNRKIKVVFVSVVEISSERLRSLLNDGVSGYITKPFSPKDLVSSIKAII